LDQLLIDTDWALKISLEAKQFVQANFNNFTLTKHLVAFIKTLGQ